MDGNQRQAQVPYVDEQTVQDSLVGRPRAFGHSDQPGLFRIAQGILHALFFQPLCQIWIDHHRFSS